MSSESDGNLLRAAYKDDIYNVKKAEEYLTYLVGNECLSELQGVWGSCVENIYPNQELWTKYITLLRSSGLHADALKEIEAAYQAYPNIVMAEYYCFYVVSEEIVKANLIENAMDVLWNIYEAVSLWFIGSQKIWNIYTSFSIDSLEESSFEKKQLIARLNSAYQQRLRAPHEEIDDTFVDYCTFLNTYYKERYDEVVSKANKTVQKTKELCKRIEKYELNLLHNHDLNLFAEYISRELKNLPGSKHKMYVLRRDMIRCLYERVNYMCPRTGEVWEDYLLFIFTKGYDTSNLKLMTQRAISLCPWSGKLRCFMLRLEESNSIDLFEAKSKIEEISYFELSDEESYTRWKPIALTVLEMLNRRLQNEKEIKEDISSLTAQCKLILEVVYEFGLSDAKCDIPVLVSHIFTKLKLIHEAKVLLKNCAKHFGHVSYYWRKRVEWESINGSNEDVTAAYEEALSRRDIDDYESLLDEYLLHQGTHSESLAYYQYVAKAKRFLDNYYSTRHQKLAEISEESRGPKRSATPPEEMEGKQVQKKHKKEQLDFKRDREHSLVIIHGFPLDKGEVHLRKFFEDCGEIRAISLHNEYALLEFTDASGALSAQTRDGKSVDGREISVKSGKDTTVYVTNYNPTETKESLNSLFSTCGDVVDIRFPSLKYNSRRRFCYVQFATAESAYKAVDHLDGTPSGEDSNSKLMVRISEPERKQERQGALDEGREVVVKNIDFDVTLEELRAFFAKFGEIETIKLPTGSNKSRHKGYAFITFQSALSSKASVDSNGTALKSRELSVEIASKKPKITPVTVFSADNKPVLSQNHLRLAGVSDTVSAEQLKAILVRFGSILKLSYSCSDGTAEVWFESPAASGKASLALDGSRDIIPTNGGAIKVAGSRSTVSQRSFVPRSARKKAT